jgi:hypothetical protein
VTLQQLRKLSSKWQTRLRLLDWDIYVRWAFKQENEDVWGICYPSNTTKEAVIIMQNPRLYKELDPDYYQADVEVTLVHEILHLHFAPFNNPSGSHMEMIEEIIVSHLAQLLVALDRRDESVLNPQNPRRLSKVAGFHNPDAA